MRDLVTHLSTGIVLDLYAADFGHPNGDEILRSLHGHMSRSDPQLLCAKHGSPLYLQMRPVRQGSNEHQMCGIHFDSNQSHRPPASGMSDEHKRQTDYIVRAAEEAGYQAEREVGLSSNVRPDAVIYGPDVIAVEVQRSSLTRATAITRTRKAVAGGMAMSVWFSDKERRRLPPWFWGVPSISMNQLSWDVVPPTRAVTVTTGAREIFAVQCRFPNFERCPKTGGRCCGQSHPDHRPWMGLTVDDVALLAPLGKMRPLRFLGKHILLVSENSHSLYEELIGQPAELVLNPATERMITSRPLSRIECVTPQGPIEAQFPATPNQPVVVSTIPGVAEQPLMLW